MIKEDYIQDEENACGRTASKTSRKSKKKYRKSEEKFDP
jgi:hypothetical protein